MLWHNNELKADISVMKKENYVMTIKTAKSKIFVAIDKFFVAIENGS